jgi:RNA polymerase sigma-70 factor (family 1)
MTEINDQILALRLNNNEVKAFDALFHKYSNKLYRFSFSLLKNEEDSKEIVQETFCKIWDKRKELDSGKSVKSFIFTISYNLIIDQLRLRLKDEEYRKFLEQHFRENPFKQGTDMDYETIKKEIDKAVEELPAKRRQIYRLSREKGLSHKKIAAQLDIKEKTVENHINLALRHIKSRLSNELLAVLLFFSLFV